MKTDRSKIKLLAVLVAMASFVAPAHRAQAEKPAPVAPAAAELQIDIKGAKKEEVRHSMMGPLNTRHFYTFSAEKAVLVVRIDSQNSIAGTLHIFDPAATEDSIGMWVNNHHSDALFADAATPAQSLKLPDGIITITEHKHLGRGAHPPRNETFSEYHVKFTAKEHRVEGKYRLAAFADEANVFVKEKDP